MAGIAVEKFIDSVRIITPLFALLKTSSANKI
jgi:hypothetical protein